METPGSGFENSATTSTTTTTDEAQAITLPRQIIFSQAVRSVCCGWSHSALITIQNQLFTWGSNSSQQLGHGSNAPVNEGSPRLVTNLQSHSIRQVSCGWKHTIAIDSENCIFVWGSSSHGQLGIGDYETRSTPTQLVLPTRFTIQPPSTSVSQPSNSSDRSSSHPSEEIPGNVCCGWQFTAVLCLSGNVYCFGNNSHGQLGAETPNQNLKMPPADDMNEDQHPSVVRETSQFANPSSEASSSAVTDSVEQLETIGGRIDTRSTNVPALMNKSRFERLKEKAKARAMARRQNCSPVPVRVPLDCRISSIDCGWSHSLALTKEGVVYSWGRGDLGQVGTRHPQTACPPAPVEFPLASNQPGKDCSSSPNPGHGDICRIWCGSEHSLALSRTGTLFSWGWNEHGNLGHGHTQNCLLPTVVEAWPSATKSEYDCLATGGAAVLALWHPRS